MKDSCCEDNRLITIEQALQKIKQQLTPINGSERVPLKRALGRILSNSVSSPVNIPLDNNSAMDGYAFSSSEIIAKQSFTLLQAGTSWAGKPYQQMVNKGECIRIFTGAVIPEGADSVIMQEQVSKDGFQITFPATTQGSQNIRHAGGDVEKNATLLTAPIKLTAIDIGLLASAGIYDVEVNRKINVGYFSTGNELCSIGQALEQGQIYESNRYTLYHLLNDNHFNCCDLGVIPDDKQRIEETILRAAKEYDVVITTGGASVGEADYIKEILDHIGEVGFWKIAIKPGKPMAFGKINHCCFLGLPGNPVSVISTFHTIVIPALQHLSGLAVKKRLRIKATCTSTLKKGKGRQEYKRGILSQGETGQFFVESAGKQGSNIMSAMSKANCYIVLPIDSEGVISGQQVDIEPFEMWI